MRVQMEAMKDQLQGLRSEFAEMMRASLASAAKQLEGRRCPQA